MNDQEYTQLDQKAWISGENMKTQWGQNGQARGPTKKKGKFV